MRPARSLIGCLTLAAVIALSSFGTGSRAASLSVTPTRLAIGPEGGTAMVTLENRGTDETLVQLGTFGWLDNPDTAALEATRELLAVPPLFSLSPGQKQIIRVALRRPVTDGRERSYRLLITEVPPPAGDAGGVRLALRLSLPVFVVPEAAAARPVWTLRRLPGGEGELSLANDGTAHVQVIRVDLLAGDDGKAVHTVDQPAYVLAGKQRVWRVPQAAMAAGARGLRVKAESDIGELRADLSPGGG